LIGVERAAGIAGSADDRLSVRPDHVLRHLDGHIYAHVAGTANQASLVIESGDRPVLPRNFAGAAAHAAVDPTLESRALQDAVRRAIATRGGSCSWTVDHASWMVTLHPRRSTTSLAKR
jgi:hypothetical protein